MKKIATWLLSKLRIARWVVLERVSRGIVEEALIKAPVQLALLVRQSKLVTSESDSAIDAISTAENDALGTSENHGQYPAQFNINPRTEELLRGLVLKFEPRKLVETGVANGVSTRVLLSAMDELLKQSRQSERADSLLHSLDISSSVATPDLAAHPNWQFHLVDETMSFSNIMEEIGEIDFFFHDSNHSYWNQLMEYQVAWEHLLPGGILVSDDINWSQAFLHFCQDKELEPVVLADGPKFVGLIVKTEV